MAWHAFVFTALMHLFSYQRIIFSGNYTGFTVRGYNVFKRFFFYKTLFSGPLTLVFSPLQVLVAEFSYRRGLLANLGVDDYH